jgi:hypothetical protein
VTGRHAKGPASAGAEGEARSFDTGNEVLNREPSTDQDCVLFPRRWPSAPYVIHVVVRYQAIADAEVSP